MKFIDVTALSDAVVTTNGIKSFADLSLLSNTEATEGSNYATLGRNLFVLDGSLDIMSNNPQDIGYWSAAKSNDNCEFTTNPKITVNFTGQHTTSGLTFYFAGYYPAEIRVSWYSLTGVKIVTETFEPDQLIYIARKQVANFGKLEIEFTKTCLPGQYIQLQYLFYGRYIQWTADEIKKATVDEELDVTSDNIAINTAAIELIDDKNDFDISNPNGAWQSVQKNQEVAITETINGAEVPMGTFYIDKFSFQNNIAKFELIDSIGVLDLYPFETGTIYNNVTVSSLVAEIMSGTGLKYELEQELGSISLSGYLAVQTRRKALQQIAFVIGAAVDDSRSDTIRIYRADRESRYTIDIDRKLNGQTKVEQGDYISSVSIEFSKYNLGSEATEIYNDQLPEGITKIIFSAPCKADTVTVTGGTVVEVRTNYVIVNMAAAGQCRITAIQYEASKFTVSRKVDLVEAGNNEKDKQYNGITLYNNEVIADTLASLLRYHSLRKTLDMKYLLNYEQVGQWANIKDRAKRNNLTLIESQSIDLTGGFIAKASCKGYTLIIPSEYFTGQELYTQEIGGGLL
jgi:hypothetical protein